MAPQVLNTLHYFTQTPATMSESMVSFFLLHTIENMFPTAPCFYNSLFWGVFVLLLTCPFVTQDGDSALTLAARCGQTSIVVELVKAGAKLDLQNKVWSHI